MLHRTMLLLISEEKVSASPGINSPASGNGSGILQGVVRTFLSLKLANTRILKVVFTRTVNRLTRILPPIRFPTAFGQEKQKKKR